MPLLIVLADQELATLDCDLFVGFRFGLHAMVGACLAVAKCPVALWELIDRDRIGYIIQGECARDDEISVRHGSALAKREGPPRAAGRGRINQFDTALAALPSGGRLAPRRALAIA